MKGVCIGVGKQRDKKPKRPMKEVEEDIVIWLEENRRHIHLGLPLPSTCRWVVLGLVLLFRLSPIWEFMSNGDSLVYHVRGRERKRRGKVLGMVERERLKIAVVTHVNLTSLGTLREKQGVPSNYCNTLSQILVFKYHPCTW